MSRKKRARRERRAEERRVLAALERLRARRELLVIGPNGDQAVSIPGVGAIFFSLVEGVLVVESVAHSGPGVEDRRARLEAMLRAGGFGAAIDASHRRAREAS